MAHRTVVGPRRSVLVDMLHPWPMSQPIERKPIPARARRLRDGPAQGRLDPAMAFEPAIRADVDDDVFALETEDERRSWQR